MTRQEAIETLIGHLGLVVRRNDKVVYPALTSVDVKEAIQQGIDALQQLENKAKAITPVIGTAEVPLPHNLPVSTVVGPQFIPGPTPPVVTKVVK